MLGTRRYYSGISPFLQYLTTKPNGEGLRKSILSGPTCHLHVLVQDVAAIGRTMTVAGARETIGSQVVQQNGIQCFNCKGFGHYAKECRKPKRWQVIALADRMKRLMNRNWKHITVSWQKIQEVLPEESGSTEQPLEQGVLTFANPRYLKKAQSEKPCLYEIPYDNSDHANRFAPDREETMTLANESRSKIDK
ncbi:ribonuclease H [Tanacetum coccineum]|uniref:Ribonuclease H n=1 Tax=Tanacetum coccineum TaxID=301880 RepID=A0ABQ5CDZ7_9ASTR